MSGHLNMTSTDLTGPFHFGEQRPSGGGPAFPAAFTDTTGMTHRDYLRAHAPITRQDVELVYGDPIPTDDDGRAAFFAVWALLASEYADAMLAVKR